jgi:purine-binding chemotaxis protein CheW
MNLGETYIIFELGNSAYALPSGDVMHIEMLEHITPVPNTAPSVEGIVFSRGRLFPALSLRVRFGLERVPATPRSRLIFVTVHERTVALIVDSAREFRRIPHDAIRPVEQELPGVQGNYVRGVATVGDRMVLLVDVVRVLNLDDPAPIVAAEAAAAAQTVS